MKRVEVSAISSNGWAISPCGEHLYGWSNARRRWFEVDSWHPLPLWNLATKNHRVYRGVFTIKVWE